MTTPHSERTVSDKLVDQAFVRMAKRLVAEYEKCCPHQPASPEWFERLDRAETKLHEILGKRPISKAEIVATSERCFKSLRQALGEEKQKQPKFHRCLTLGGEEHFIPDYGE